MLGSQDVTEVDNAPPTSLDQFKGSFVAARQALQRIERRQQAVGLRFDFQNEVTTALAGIAEGRIVAKVGNDHQLVFGRVNYHPEAIMAVVRAFGGSLPIVDNPTGEALAKLISESITRESPEGSGAYKNFVNIPSAIDGVDLRLFSGHSGGFGVGLVLKPDGVASLYKDMQEAGYTNPVGGKNKLLLDLSSQVSVITATAGSPLH